MNYSESAQWIQIKPMETKQIKFVDQLFQHLTNKHSFESELKLKTELQNLEDQRKNLQNIFSMQLYLGESTERVIIEYCKSIDLINLLCPSDQQVIQGVNWVWKCSSTENWESFSSLKYESAAVYYNLGVFEYQSAEQLSRTKERDKMKTSIKKLRGAWWAFEQALKLINEEQSQSKFYDLSSTNLSIMESYLAGLTYLLIADNLNHSNAQAKGISGIYFQSSQLLDKTEMLIQDAATKADQNSNKINDQIFKNQIYTVQLLSKRSKGIAYYIMSIFKYNEVRYEETTEAKYNSFAEAFCLINHAYEITNLQQQQLKDAGIVGLERDVKEKFKQFQQSKEQIYQIADWPKIYTAKFEQMPLQSSPLFSKYHQNSLQIKINSQEIQKTAINIRALLEVEIEMRQTALLKCSGAFLPTDQEQVFSKLRGLRQQQKFMFFSKTLQNLEGQLKQELKCLDHYLQYQEGFAENHDQNLYQISQIDSLRGKNYQQQVIVKELLTKIQQKQSQLTQIIEQQPLGDLINQPMDEIFSQQIFNLYEKIETPKQAQEICIYFDQVLKEDYEFLIYIQMLKLTKQQVQNEIMESFSNAANELMDKKNIPTSPNVKYSEKTIKLMKLKEQVDQLDSFLQSMEQETQVFTKQVKIISQSTFGLALEHKQKTDVAYIKVKNTMAQDITKSKIIAVKVSQKVLED